MTVAVRTATSVLAQIDEYVDDVLSGRVIAGRLVQLACERHKRDCGLGSLRGLHFDDEAAAHAVEFFSRLKHTKGEWATRGGQPIRLEPWQVFVVGSLFGWMRADGLRRFRRCYLSVARKNGKTTIAAGIGLYLAFFDAEPGAEVYAAATTEEQARICWDAAKAMVSKSPDLLRRISPLANRLVREDNGSMFGPISKEADSQEGKSPHGAIIDEYHAHVSGELASVLELGTGARRQPLMLFTTTAGTEGESPCRDMDRDCIAILEQNADADDVFAYIARIDDGDRWDDPGCWVKANPGLGVSVKLDNLETACDSAKRTPRLQPEFIRKRCNRWSQQEKRWIHLEDWDACAGRTDWTQLIGATCYAGLDLSSTTDLTAFVAVFPDGSGGYDVDARFWIPEENIQDKTARDGAPYQAWVDAGLITTTEGNITDYDVVREEIRNFAGSHDLREIPYDKWNATQLATQLEGDGATMVQFPQGFSGMNEPARLLESLVLTRRIRHGGNPVLRWMMANVAVKGGPNDTIRPVKGNPNARIDGVVALTMALGRAMVHQADATPTEAHLW